MPFIIPTFHLGGRCEEAIALYQKALGLKIDFLGKDEATGEIYHTEARIGGQRVRLSDGGTVGAKAESLFLAVVFETDGQVREAFDILKEGGTVIEPPHAEEFVSSMSALTDKFGYKWFLMT